VTEWWWKGERDSSRELSDTLRRPKEIERDTSTTTGDDIPTTYDIKATRRESPKYADHGQAPT